MRKDIPKTLCPLPWISVETSALGECRVCCQANDLIKKPDNTPYSMKDSTLEEAFNSDWMRDLRKQFLAGKRPDLCKNCWNEEDGGRTSKRQNTIKIFADDYYKRDFKNIDNTDLLFLDLKLGTVCNLKCRICGTWSSSKFAKEDIDLREDGLDKKETKAYQHLKMGNWPRETKDFWENLKILLKKITYIEFTGGEPMMIQEHFDLLKYAVEQGHSKRIKIHYNTNTTHLPMDALKNIWPHFRAVEFAFSVDDIEKRFEYQRYGTDWKESNFHMETIIANAKEHWGWDTQLCLTISIFNVNNLVETTKWAHDMNFDTHYYNIVHNPPHWNVQSLPKHVKNQIASKLTDPRLWNNFPKRFITELVHVAHYMRQKDTWTPELHEFRLNEINRRDLYRGQLLEEVDPITWKLLNEKEK